MAITLPQDVQSTSDRCLFELENQVQRLMEAHLAPTQPTQVNKVTTSCQICSGPHDTQYCMKDPEQAFVEYASSRTDEVGDDGEVIFIEIIQDNDESQNKGPNDDEGAITEGPAIECFDTCPTRDELTYHKNLMSGLIPLIFQRKPIITK
nr:MAK10-like protein [Tanacetum cinerariifolium]